MRTLSVVLFGGTGFIGSHLAARLAERNVSIAAATRHEAHAMHLMPLGVDIVEADIRDDADNHLVLLRATPGKPFVYHVASAWDKGSGFRTRAAWDAFTAGETLAFSVPGDRP